MATTLTNPNYASKSSDTPTTPATASFDEFAQSRAKNGTSISIDANEKYEQFFSSYFSFFNSL